MLKKLAILVAMTFINTLYSQDFSLDWTGYFSYNEITALSRGDDKVFAAAQNAVFSYDLLTNEIETCSTIQGLTGEDISALYYSESSGILFIGYDSGAIDIVREDEQVLTVVDIKNKTSIPPTEKQINSFDEYNGLLYISTGFGISLYDLERLEFEDSYFIGNNGGQLNVTQTAILGNYIYASTDAGMRRALVANDNLIDYKNWTTIANGSWRGVAVVGSTMYAINTDRSLQRFNGLTSFNTVGTFASVPLHLSAATDFLTLTLADQVFVYNESGNVIANAGVSVDFPGAFSTAITSEGNLFTGTVGSGLLISDVTTATDLIQVLPDGPSRNDPFSIEAVPDQLWVVYGDYSASFNPYPLKNRGLSHLRKETGWVNIPFEEIFGATNLVNITISPDNAEQAFISSYHSGLLEINEDVPVKLFDESNSGLADIPVNPQDVRINGAAFDNSGKLWMTTSLVENALAVKTGEQIESISIEPAITNYEGVDAYTQLVIGGQGNVYFGTNNNGLVGYRSATGEFAVLTSEGSNLPTDDVRSLAIDNNGTLWIGTTGGLRVLNGPARMFEDADVTTNPIVILENDIPVELLNDQVILSIEVDGSNNKWISTVSSGAFYFSSDGQETLQQFNTSNSPLPSNNIQDITIDSASGKVYFATPRGLVAFDGSAVAPAEDLTAVRAFPNPVRPKYDGMVTIDGLTERANVKITDITGNLVYEQISEGGSIQWDTTAFGRHKVASGVYMILVTGEDAVETKVAKLMIIR